MKPVLEAAAEVQAVCEAQQWRFCFIGGLALLRWGEPRETVDVDLTLLTGFADEDRYLAVLMAHFAPRIDNATQFALANRVLLLEARSGVGIDIASVACPSKSRSWRAPVFSPTRAGSRFAPVPRKISLS